MNKKIKELLSDNSFFNLPLFRNKYNPKMGVIIGSRSCGKTYSFKKMALENWISNKKQCLYLRRYETEFDTIANFWSDILLDPKYKDYTIEAVAGKFYISKRGETAPESHVDDKYWTSKNNQYRKVRGEVLGYYMPLSKHQKFKGSSYPDITLIAFDEFILEETTHNHYLKEEVSALMSIFFTVDRSREETFLLLLSNSGSINNPYNLAYEVSLENFKDSPIQRRNNKSVVFVNIEDDTVRNDNLMSIAPQEYLDYAVSNKYKDDDDSRIEKRRKGMRPLASFVVFKNQYIRVYSDDKGACLVAEDYGDADAICISKELAEYGYTYYRNAKKTLTKIILDPKTTFDNTKAKFRAFSAI